MNCNINSSVLHDINAFNQIGTNATVLSTLNVVGDVNTSGLSVFTMNSNIDKLNATSTTLLTYLII